MATACAHWHRRFGLALIIALAAPTFVPAEAATPEQTAKLQQAGELIHTASTQFRARRYASAANSLREAQRIVVELNEVPEFVVPLSQLRAQLEQAHATFIQRGIRLPPLQLPPLPADAVAAAQQTANPRRRVAPLPAADLSFVKHIGPILVTRCARCHINKTEGKLSMATFESLKAGTPDGPIILPGKGAGSRIVEVIETGDMPRAGPKVTKAELAAITKWIDEGARFDGPDEKSPLLRSAPGSPTATSSESRPPAMARATLKETVQFSRDVAPLLAASCVECHSGAQPKGRLSMESYATFIQGGQSGAPWSPGNADESLLVRKLKGQAGARMPLERDPLADDVIARIATWVNEGARFDGDNPAEPVARLAAVAQAKSTTAEQLSAARRESARTNWRLAVPDAKPLTADTKNFFLIGDVPAGELEAIGQAAEGQVAAIARHLRAPADGPLVKGGIPLLVFRNRYEYGEFGQMAEDRKLPPDWRGHWRFDSTDAYVAMVPPEAQSDYSLAGLIGQQVASVYAASLSVGGVPRWFAEGTGRAYLARVDQQSSRAQQWNRRLGELRKESKIESFLQQGLSADDNDVAAYGFVRALMSDAGKYNALLTALRADEGFDAAFTRIYGWPEAVAAAWAKSGR